MEAESTQPTQSARADLSAAAGGAGVPADILAEIAEGEAWRAEREGVVTVVRGRITGCERQGEYIALRVEVEEDGAVLEYVGRVTEEYLTRLPPEQQRGQLVEAVRQERERRRRRVDVTRFVGDVTL